MLVEMDVCQKEAGAMKRIFVLSSFPLFIHGVESLLHGRAGLEIVGREKDVEKGLQRIEELRPDVVILDSDSRACEPTLAVMRILGEGGDVQVITYSLQDNTMRTYCGEQWVIREVGDLVRAIEHSPFSPHPERSQDAAGPGQPPEWTQQEPGEDGSGHEC
jgi:hypothetical protein